MLLYCNYASMTSFVSLDEQLPHVFLPKRSKSHFPPPQMSMRRATTPKMYALVAPPAIVHPCVPPAATIMIMSVISAPTLLLTLHPATSIIPAHISPMTAIHPQTVADKNVNPRACAEAPRDSVIHGRPESLLSPKNNIARPRAILRKVITVSQLRHCEVEQDFFIRSMIEK